MLPDNLAETYHVRLGQLLETVKEKSSANIQLAAQAAYETMRAGRLVHAWGSGHSSMFPRELFYRSSGLSPFSPIYDYNSTGPFGRSSTIVNLDGRPEYADVILSQHDAQPGEMALIFSSPGISALSVEMCNRLREAGLKTVAFCGVNYASGLKPRHPSGKRLHDVADIVVDMHLPLGDIAISIEDEDIHVGGFSTLVGVYIVQMLVASIVDLYRHNGETAPLVKAAVLPGAAEHNNEIYKAIRSRLRFL
jgi:uncharacterized phosphosugar-binding protein